MGHGRFGPRTGNGESGETDPLAMMRAVKNAATPAIDIWPSEICPTYPVNTT